MIGDSQWDQQQALEVLIIEDHPEVRRWIREKLKTAHGLDVTREYQYPWYLTRLLDDENRFAPRPGPGVIIADLISPSYWTLSPHEPAILSRRPRHPDINDPIIIRDAALDCVTNYLRRLTRIPTFSVVVYSHVFTFLERRQAAYAAREVEAAIEDIGVAPQHIIRKGELRGVTPQEIATVAKLAAELYSEMANKAVNIRAENLPPSDGGTHEHPAPSSG